jgi:CTP-dependent riboflavin kinase
VVLNTFGTITKNDFIKIVMNINNPTGSSNPIYLMANNSVVTNYHTQFLQGNGSGTFAGRENDARADFLFAGKNSFNITYGKISENDRFNFFANSHITLDSGVYLNYHYTTSSWATFTSGITSLTIEGTVTNGIGTGSRIQIYRLDAEKVADITVASNTTQVDISSLSIGKDSEYLLVTDLIYSGNGGAQLMVNDSTTNTDYYHQRITGSGTSAGAERANRADISATSNVRGLIYSHIKLSEIGAYTSQNYGIRDVGSSNIGVQNYVVSSTAENITSITKINIKGTTTNGIASGTRFHLYKLK